MQGARCKAHGNWKIGRVDKWSNRKNRGSRRNHRSRPDQRSEVWKDRPLRAEDAGQEAENQWSEVTDRITEVVLWERLSAAAGIGS